jgi:predicted nucleotidyltransferase
MSTPRALGRLDPRYVALYDAIAVAAARAGVEEIRLGGSLGRGDADSYSDLDLTFVVADPATIDPAAIIRAATPTVLLRTLPFGVFSITPDWLRVDIVVSNGAEPTLVRAPDLRGLVEEFLRVLGLLPVVIGRGEWIVASDGAWLLRTLLVQLLLAGNGESVVTGVKRLNTKLTSEQRRLVESLPPIVAERGGAIAAHLATAERFLPCARALVRDWPDELERATRDHLFRELGLDLGGA